MKEDLKKDLLCGVLAIGVIAALGALLLRKR